MTEQIGLQAVFQTTQFQQGLNQYVNGIDRAKGATTQAAGSATAAGNVITSAIGYALGTVVVQAAMAAVSALGNFIRSGLQTVATFQMLEISIESLVAKELLLSGSVNDMSTAMAQAVPITDILMQRLQQIALISPFSYEEVVAAYRLSISYGVTADQALKLSEAILNMAVVSGQGQIAIERITRSLSQMQATGKITMIDVRELANSGVNLAQILQNQLGMSIDEVNAKLADGSLTMREVIDAVIAFTNLTIGDAAERMSKSFMGVTNALKELGSFVARDLFTPFVELLSADLYELYESAKQLYDSGVFEGIGKALASIYNAAKDIPGAISKIIASLQNTFGSGIQKIVNDAFQWGVNIIAQLSKGIIEGAANFLIAAMKYISDLLSAWLAPGSPPKVADEIDLWGAAAMNEYLNGFSEADFGALGSLQNALSSAFSALNIDDSSGMMKNLSEMYAEALSGGELDATFFDQLTQAAGPFGAEIAELAAMNLELADATEMVAAAEAAVAAASKKEQDARQKSVALTNEYNDLLKAGAPEDVLQAKLDEINAQEEIVAQASDERKQAEMELELQEARVALLEQQISLQEQLIQQLTKLYALEDEEGGGGEGGAGEGGDGGAGGGAGGGAVTPGNFLSKLQDMLDEAKEMVEGSSSLLRDTIIAKLMDVFKPITDTWTNTIQPKLEFLRAVFATFIDNLRARWKELGERFKTDFQPFVDWWNRAWPALQNVAVTCWNIIKSVFEQVMARIQPLIETLKQKLEDLHINFGTLETVAQALGAILLTVLAAALVTVAAAIIVLGGLISGIVTAVDAAIKAFDTWKQSMVDAVSQIKIGIAEVGEGIKQITDALSGAVKDWDLFWNGLKTLITGLGDIIGGTFLTILRAVSFSIGEILTVIGGFVKGVVEFFKGLADDLVGHSIVTDMMKKLVEVMSDGFDDLLDEIEDFSSLALEGLSDWIADLVDVIEDGLDAAQDAIYSQFTNLYNKGAEIITKIADGVKSKQAYLMQAIKDVIMAAINEAINGITLGENVGNLGTSIATAIGDAIKASTAIDVALKDAITTGVTWAWDQVKGDTGILATLGKNIILKVGDGIGDNNAIPSALYTAISYATDYVRYKTNAFSLLYDLGWDLMDQLDQGMADYASNGEANRVGNTMYNKAMELLDIHNPTETTSLAPPSRMAMQPILSGNTYKTLNMPTSIVIHGGMDAATAEAFVRRIVRSEFGV